jgi:high-affinity K+ transport system ATPase subunit B
MKKALIVSAMLFVILMPLAIYIGDQDDAPGVVLIGLIIVLMPTIISGVRKLEKIRKRRLKSRTN